MPFIKRQIPWNKGKKGLQVAWNKGLKGSNKSNRTSFKKGHKPWNKDKKRPPFSEEWKKKIGLAASKILKGRKLSKETKKKISEFNKGKVSPMKDKKHSEESRKKMKLAHKGQIAWNKGRTNCYSLETREKMRISRMLSPNRVFKNTSIELKVQNLLKENGIDFETNYPILGQPDIFIKPNICIFADGCYWHKCPECGFEDTVSKRDKDLKITRKLQSQGYTVIRLWEHEIKNGQLNSLNQLLN